MVYTEKYLISTSTQVWIVKLTSDQMVDTNVLFSRFYQKVYSNLLTSMIQLNFLVESTQ